jgi:hypothetical protein
MTDQEIMEKVQAIRDKTGHYTAVTVEFNAYESGSNDMNYEFFLEEEQTEEFPTREALIAHLDGILNNLRPKD